MKNKVINDHIKTSYSTINYVVIDNNQQYLAGNSDKYHLRFTYLLNKAMKFYKYEDALCFVNMHHMKRYKIHKVEFNMKLIKEV